MLRTLFLLGLLGLVGFGVYQWGAGGIEGGTDKTPRKKKDRPQQIGTEPGPDEKQPREAKPTPIQRPAVDPIVTHVAQDPVRLREPLQVPDARINLVNFPEIAAQRTGKILFLGTKVPRDRMKFNAPDGKAIDEEAMRKIARKLERSFLAVETSMAEIANLQVEGYQLPGDARYWRKWRRDLDPIEPSKVNVVKVAEWYFPLKEGMDVKDGELLGLIDPQLSESEMFIKIAKLSANLAEVRAAIKTKDEAKVRYDRGLQLLARGGIGKEEVDGQKLTWERYIEEEEGKRANLEVARREIAQTDAVMRQHEIRAPLSGIIRRLIKQPNESIKEQEPVLRIENFDVLQVEGYVDEQFRRRLTDRMPVVVEPIRREGPEEKLRRHRESVTAVVVSGGTQPLVLSAGEDRTVRVWELRRERNQQSGKEQWTGVESYRLDHPSIVRSLACTPPGAVKNLCLTGAADGVGTLWNLDQIDKGTRQTLKQTHRGPIFATAFSSDGAWCATAGEDKSIIVWNAANGQKVVEFPGAHKGAVTSLAFTPEGLVSAGRDNRLVFWPFKDGKKGGRSRELDQRGGQVEQLGATLDGKYVLFDQGTQLRVLDLGDWSSRGILRNPSGGATFTNFALFSPDGRMVLTANSAENRLQLWNNPVVNPRRRGTELRQFVWTDGPATCAAFDPRGRFVVTGTRDRHVLVWALPTEQELQEPEIVGELRHVGQTLDSSSRQVRVLVDVPRKTDRLIPGDKATLVIYPQ